MQPLHHDPIKARAYAFKSLNRQHANAPRLTGFVLISGQQLTASQVVAPRIELSATALSGPFGQPVLDYRVNRDGRIRTDVAVLPRHVGRLYPTSRYSIACCITSARTLSASNARVTFAVSATSPSSANGSASSIGNKPKKKARRRYDTRPCGSSKSKTKCQKLLFLSFAGA
jgi:hypothetical protein